MKMLVDIARPRRQGHVGSVLLVFGCLAFAACGDSAGERAAGQPDSQAAPETLKTCAGPPESASMTVMADWLPFAGEGPLVSADVAELFEKEGLSVDVSYPASPGDPIKFAASGRQNIVVTYMPAVMLAQEQELPVISLGVNLRHMNLGIGSLTSANIKSPADLKGKTIAITPKPEALAYLETMLESAGLTMDDVKTVDPGFGIAALLLQKKADAAYISPNISGIPVQDQLEEEEGSSEKLEFMQFTDHGVPELYYLIYAANEDWAAENPNTVCHFMAAIGEGAKLWEQDDTAQPALRYMAEHDDVFTLDQQERMRQEFLEIDQWRNEDGFALVQDEKVWADSLAWAKERGVVKKIESADSYFTNAYVPLDPAARP